MTYLESAIAGLFCVGAVGGGIAVFAAAEDSVEEQLWRVVRIVQGEWVPNYGNYSPLGSGVLLVRGGRGFVVTNEHVAAKATKPIAVVFRREAFVTSVLDVDKDHDLAILGTDLRFEGESQEWTASVVEGQDLIALGYPDTVGASLSPVRMDGRVLWTGRYALDIGVAVTSRNFFGRSMPAFIMSGHRCTAGFSGGPVFDATGALVGYVKGSGDQGGCVGVAIGRAIELLQRLPTAKE